MARSGNFLEGRDEREEEAWSPVGGAEENHVLKSMPIVTRLCNEMFIQ